MSAPSGCAPWHHNAIVVTKVEDFAARSMRESSAPIVVWLRVGNSTNSALRPWFEERLPGILELLQQGNRLIEVV